jgi:molybdenum cofactor cytidylyltransferase
LAELHGTPILQYVLNVCAVAALDPVVVVLGSDAEAIVTRLWWRNEVRVINPDPAEGISSSVRMGLASLALSDAERAVVLPGDQPRLSETQLGEILAAAPDAARPIVVPRYQGQPGNPVLLERAAWHLANQIDGDTGMVQLFRSRPELLRYIDVQGTNPDVDTPADLAAFDSPPEG